MVETLEHDVGTTVTVRASGGSLKSGGVSEEGAPEERTVAWRVGREASMKEVQPRMRWACPWTMWEVRRRRKDGGCWGQVRTGEHR